MFRLSIETNNAAFEDNKYGELARILREVARRLETGVVPATVLDVNGNKVGKVSMTGKTAH